MKEVTIYTDGACSGNPGPGGWGAVLCYKGTEKELSGGEAMTTNNRMELTAAVYALKALKEPCRVYLYSDSKYLVDSLMKGWVIAWEKRGWVKADKKPALNADLWQELLRLDKVHEITYHWVKGHADDDYNNRCDELAVARRDEYAALGRRGDM
ncbi:MAG: ribonuclease HI [Eubacteriales bacterium]|nr:ribonuclease HI [Eubacteriales bacterium]